MATANLSATLHFVKKYPITLCGFSLLFMPSVHRLLFYFSPLLLSTAIFVVAMATWGPRSRSAGLSASPDEEPHPSVENRSPISHDGSPRSAGDDANLGHGNATGADDEPDPDLLVELEVRRDQHACNEKDEPDPDLLLGDHCEGENPKPNGGESISFQSRRDAAHDDDRPSSATAHDDEPAGFVQLHPQEVVDTVPYVHGDDQHMCIGSQDDPIDADHVRGGIQVEENRTDDGGHAVDHQTFMKRAHTSSNCEPHRLVIMESLITSSLADAGHHRRSSSGTLATHHGLQFLQATA